LIFRSVPSVQMPRVRLQNLERFSPAERRGRPWLAASGKCKGQVDGNIKLVTVARTRPDQSAVKQASRPFRYSKGFQIQCWMH
jgi:hypothetical protein